MRRRAPIIAILMALVLWGCTSTEDPAETGAGSTEQPAGSTPTTVVPTDSSASTAAGDDGGAPVPTEVGRGVTDDTIKVGVSILDLSSIGRDNGDVEAKWQVAIDAVNEAGGVHGRQLEMVSGSYNPTADTEAEEVCLVLSGDEEVFVVLGPQIFDQALCYTERNNTAVISSQPISREQLDRSEAPLFSLPALPERTVTQGIEAMAAVGTFDNTRVAVHATSEGAADVELALAALASVGADVAVDTVMASARDDRSATEAEMAVISQRWAADDVGVVVTVGDGGHLTAALAIGQNNVDATLAMTQPDIDPALFTEFGADIAALEGAVGVQPPTFEELYEQDRAGVVECVTRFEEASGEVVNLTAEAGETANLVTTVWACQVVELFVLMAEAAGPALNYESLVAATNGLGQLSLTAIEEGSLSPEKPDVSDVPPAVVVYASSSNSFVPA
ncbi:MAG: hypothetical protein ACR2QE_00930 [Acidimicrobiales bacterium]